jgi:uncharacterized protein
VLVYAQRGGTPEHDRIGSWLQDVANASAPFGLSTLVLSGALRLLTHPRVFANPTALADALAFIEALRERPNCIEPTASRSHLGHGTGRFSAGCARKPKPPATRSPTHIWPLAIESGSDWITTDAGFARYAGLRRSHPLAYSQGNQR